ncbi:TRAP transporter large permease subunit [Paracoccus sp. S3-43]|uniref:TRAP transporter large permease subunit n=1 Tax=Paracoccus sp. S3-43 TaxID=3030011 RepID=UPI0023AF2C18|nr:TRAP transporter large permease subunit [Paracoccus sp. S3-43]WEF23987.1 TRAP transporter large permease subunit [Paracoccus sp. S3-43]
MEMTGFAAMAAVIALLVLRMPVALSLMIPGAVGLALMGAGDRAWDQLAALLTAPDLAAMPLVVLLGNLAFYAGFATRVHDAAAVLLQNRRGGLAGAAILGCAGFAATCGSSVACAATMSRIAVPEMLRAGYDPRLAGASVAIGSTLGALLPPSMLLILWALLTGTPIAAMFLGALIPAALSLAGMIAVLFWWVHSDPPAAPPSRALPMPRGAALRAVWPAPLLFGIILGGLWTGQLSAAAALAICVVLTLAAALVQRRLTAETLWAALRDSAMQAASILLILIGARLFLTVLDLTAIPSLLVRDAGFLPHLAAVALLALACAVLGLLAEPAAILVLALPFALGIGGAHGLDPVWSGILLVKMVEIALILPPLGLNAVVVAAAVRDIRTGTVLAGLGRFLFLDLLVLAALALFPALA